MSDPINSPAHYAAGGMEPIDYLKLKLTPEEFAGFCKGNVIKYLSRANHKNGEEDLKKAAFYARFLAGDDPRKAPTTSAPAHADYPPEGRYESYDQLMSLSAYAMADKSTLFIQPDAPPTKAPITTDQVFGYVGKYVIGHCPQGYKPFPGK